MAARPEGPADRVAPLEAGAAEVVAQSRPTGAGSPQPIGRNEAPPPSVAHPEPMAHPEAVARPGPVARIEPSARTEPQPAALAVAAAPRPDAGPGTLPRNDGEADDPRPTCTVAQLRRFIKSRPWIPMHELRRRFGIWGGDDDVSPIRVGEHTLFIGLPPAEARLMAELLGGGDVGFELSLDPVTPIVVGVYPMRPVPRG